MAVVGHPGIMLSAACRSLQAVWGLVLRSGSEVWFFFMSPPVAMEEAGESAECADSSAALQPLLVLKVPQLWPLCLRVEGG